MRLATSLVASALLLPLASSSPLAEAKGIHKVNKKGNAVPPITLDPGNGNNAGSKSAGTKTIFTPVKSTTTTKPKATTCPKVGDDMSVGDIKNIPSTYRIMTWAKSNMAKFNLQAKLAQITGNNWLYVSFGNPVSKGGFGVSLTQPCALQQESCASTQSGLYTRKWCLDKFKAFYVYKAISNWHDSTKALYDATGDSFDTLLGYIPGWVATWGGADAYATTPLPKPPAPSTAGSLVNIIGTGLIMGMGLIPGLQAVSMVALIGMQTINGVISATDKVAGVGLPPLDTPPGVGNLTVLLQGANEDLKQAAQANIELSYNSIMSSPASTFQNLLLTNYLDPKNDFTQNTVLTSYKANFIGNVQQNIFSYLMQQQNVYLLKITQYFTTTPCTEDTLASNGLDSDFFFCSADGKAAYAFRVPLQDRTSASGDQEPWHLTWTACNDDNTVSDADIKARNALGFFPLYNINGQFKNTKVTSQYIAQRSETCNAANPNNAFTQRYPTSFLKTNKPSSVSAFLKNYVPPNSFKQNCEVAFNFESQEGEQRTLNFPSQFNLPICSDRDQNIIRHCNFQAHTRLYAWSVCPGSYGLDCDVSDGQNFGGSDYGANGPGTTNWCEGDFQSGYDCYYEACDDDGFCDNETTGTYVTKQWQTLSWFCDQQSTSWFVDKSFTNYGTHDILWNAM